MIWFLVHWLVVALGLTGAALSKGKPGKPPHKPKGLWRTTRLFDRISSPATGSRSGSSTELPRTTACIGPSAHGLERA